MDLTETLLREIAQKVLGTTSSPTRARRSISRSRSTASRWPRRSPSTTRSTRCTSSRSPAYLRVALAPFDVEVFPTDGVGLLQLKLFEATTEEKLVQPTFIVAHPVDVSPLARANDANPAVTDRFELFITGREIRQRLFGAERSRGPGRALHGAGRRRRKPATTKRCTTTPTTSARSSTACRPPAGEGIGIDRLVMLFTDSPSIRDVILFPQLKAEEI